MHQTVFLRRLLLVALIMIAIIGAAMFIFTQKITAWDFRNNLWGPTHLLITGRSPYLIEQLFTGSNSVWMPTIIGALFPFGWLPEFVATNLWRVASLLSVLAIYVLSIQPFEPQPSLRYTALALIGAFLFPPFASHMILGQFSLYAALLMLLAARFVNTNNLILIALLMVLAAAKPQLVALPVLGLCLVVYQRKGWRGFATLAVASIGITLVLLLPLWLSYPNWIEGMLIALGRNPAWAHPSVFTLLRGSPAIVLWMVLLIGAARVNFVLWKRLHPEQAVVWSLALNLLVTPYVWSWDFVLVLPLLFQTLFSLKSWIAKSVLCLGYLIAWLGTVNIRLTTEGDDVRFWWVVWVLVGTVLFAHLIDRRATVLPDASLPT